MQASLFSPDQSPDPPFSPQESLHCSANKVWGTQGTESDEELSAGCLLLSWGHKSPSYSNEFSTYHQRTLNSPLEDTPEKAACLLWKSQPSQSTQEPALELFRSIRAEPKGQTWMERQPGVEEKAWGWDPDSNPSNDINRPHDPFGKFQKQRYRFLICKTPTFTKGLVQCLTLITMKSSKAAAGQRSELTLLPECKVRGPLYPSFTLKQNGFLPALRAFLKKCEQVCQKHRKPRRVSAKCHCNW